MPTEGYWHDKYERKDDGLPMPVANENPWYGEDLFLKALLCVEDEINRIHTRNSDLCSSLKFGTPPLIGGKIVHYLGSAECRLCERDDNGSMEFSLNEWIWPEGFRHYVENHNVKPSDEFIKFILSKGT